MPCCLEKDFKFIAPVQAYEQYKCHLQYTSGAPIHRPLAAPPLRPPATDPAIMIALVAMSVGLLGSAHVQHLLPRHSFIHGCFDDAVVSRRRSLPIHQALAACARVRPERTVFLLHRERCMRSCMSGMGNIDGKDKHCYRSATVAVSPRVQTQARSITGFRTSNPVVVPDIGKTLTRRWGRPSSFWVQRRRDFLRSLPPP